MLHEYVLIKIHVHTCHRYVYTSASYILPKRSEGPPLGEKSTSISFCKQSITELESKVVCSIDSHKVIIYLPV